MSSNTVVIRSFVEGLRERKCALIVLLIDARHKSIVCHDSFRRFGGRLKIELRSHDPTHVEIDDIGIHATLASEGHVERCVFPWATIWAVFDGTTSAGVGTHRDAPEPGPDDPWTEKKVHRFRIVKGGKA